MNQFFYIPFAFLPSLIWLFWYLRKDKHPEPKRMILAVFVWGMLVAFPAVLIENAALGAIGSLSLPYVVRVVVIYILGVALVEEVLKFSVVQFRVLKTTAIDEPIDVMMYMIVAALGFAAIENVFLLTPFSVKGFFPTLELAFSRFVGATFLHALASATVGYYLALSFYKPSKRFSLLIHGFTFAILLHGLYNILVRQMEERFSFVFLVGFLIIFSALVVSIFLKRLSKMKSITMP